MRGIGAVYWNLWTKLAICDFSRRTSTTAVRNGGNVLVQSYNMLCNNPFSHSISLLFFYVQNVGKSNDMGTV